MLIFWIVLCTRQAMAQYSTDSALVHFALYENMMLPPSLYDLSQPIRVSIETCAEICLRQSATNELTQFKLTNNANYENFRKRSIPNGEEYCRGFEYIRTVGLCILVTSSRVTAWNVTRDLKPASGTDYYELLDHDRNVCDKKPCLNGATCLLKPKPEHNYSCACAVGFTGLHCETNMDDCRSMPCMFGAKCMDLVDNFHCQCPDGISGKRCETYTGDCSRQPCLNNATCYPLTSGYACTCAVGFTGADCEYNINECFSSPCLHGQCVDETNGYSCICDNNYIGRHCEVNKMEALCVRSDCRFGTCAINETGSYCQCFPGFEGEACDLDIDDCKSSPCAHGTCADYVNSYQCACSKGYVGRHCDLLASDPCRGEPCGGHGYCSVNAYGFSCICMPGFTGKQCETKLTVCDYLCKNGFCVHKNGNQSIPNQNEAVAPENEADRHGSEATNDHVESGTHIEAENTGNEADTQTNENEANRDQNEANVKQSEANGIGQSENKYSVDANCVCFDGFIGRFCDSKLDVSCAGTSGLCTPTVRPSTSQPTENSTNQTNSGTPSTTQTASTTSRSMTSSHSTTQSTVTSQTNTAAHRTAQTASTTPRSMTSSPSTSQPTVKSASQTNIGTPQRTQTNSVTPTTTLTNSVRPSSVQSPLLNPTVSGISTSRRTAYTSTSPAEITTLFIRTPGPVLSLTSSGATGSSTTHSRPFQTPQKTSNTLEPYRTSVKTSVTHNTQETTNEGPFTATHTTTETTPFMYTPKPHKTYETTMPLTHQLITPQGTTNVNHAIHGSSSTTPETKPTMTTRTQMLSMSSGITTSMHTSDNIPIQGITPFVPRTTGQTETTSSTPKISRPDTAPASGAVGSKPSNRYTTTSSEFTSNLMTSLTSTEITFPTPAGPGLTTTSITSSLNFPTTNPNAPVTKPSNMAYETSSKMVMTTKTYTKYVNLTSLDPRSTMTSYPSRRTMSTPYTSGYTSTQATPNYSWHIPSYEGTSMTTMSQHITYIPKVTSNVKISNLTSKSNVTSTSNMTSEPILPSTTAAYRRSSSVTLSTSNMGSFATQKNTIASTPSTLGKTPTSNTTTSIANTIETISTPTLTTSKRPITETASNIEEESSSIRGLLTMESIMIGALFVVLVAVLAIGGFLLYRRSHSGALYIRPSLSGNKRDPTIRKRYSSRDIHSDLKTGQLFSPQGVSSELYQYQEAEGPYPYPKPKSTTLGIVPQDHTFRLVPDISGSSGLDPSRPRSNGIWGKNTGKGAKRLRDKFIKNNAEQRDPTILLDSNKLGLNGFGDKTKGTKRLRDKFTSLRNSNKHNAPSTVLEPNTLGPGSVGTFDHRSNPNKAAASQEHSAALGNSRFVNRSTQNTATGERSSESLGNSRFGNRSTQNRDTHERQSESLGNSRFGNRSTQNTATHERSSESLDTTRFGERFSKNDHRAARERLEESLGITRLGEMFSNNDHRQRAARERLAESLGTNRFGERLSRNTATCEWQLNQNSQRSAYQSPSVRLGTSSVGSIDGTSRPPLTIIEDTHHYAVPTYKNRSSDNSSTASPVSSRSDNYDEVETPVVLISKPAPGQLVSGVGHITQDSERLIEERAPRYAQGTRSQDHIIDRSAEDETPVVLISKPAPGQLVSGVGHITQDSEILIEERAPRYAQGTQSHDHSCSIGRSSRTEDDTPVVWISKPVAGQLISGVAKKSQEHSIGRKETPTIWHTFQPSNGNQGDDTTSRDSYSTMSNSSDNPFFRDNNGTISLKLSSKQKSRTQEEFQYLLDEILDEEDYYKVPRPGTRSEVHYISGTDNGKSEA